MLKGLENQLLTGLRVLELTVGPSGGYAGRLLAESGAMVTKVRMVTTSLSIFRDEKKLIVEPAREIEIIETVMNLLSEQWEIILWDSHLPDDVERLLSGISNSSIGIRIQLPSGVDTDEEHTLQALGGWMELTGDPEKPPLTVGGYSAAYLVGVHAATAGLLAIIEKFWTGKGRLININALAITVSALEGAYSTFLETGVSRSRSGNRHNKISPMAILKAFDGWAFVGAPVDEKWELLEGWAGLTHRLEWSNNDRRKSNCKEIEETLGNWTRNMARDELFLTGQTFRLPFAKVQTPEELLFCPQLEARGFLGNSGSSFPRIRLPWKVNTGPTLTNGRASFLDRVSWKGLRILDLTSMWSGPYCTRIFADLGVEVIKVEAPHRPDGLRSNQGTSAPFFRELNRNKVGIQLDLRLESDCNRFLELVAVSDVLIENFSPRVMSNFGLTCEKLWKHRTDLTIVSLSAFGQTGPYRDFVGYGPTLEAMSGMAALTNNLEGVPWLPGFSVSDIGAGIHGAFVLAAALLFRNREGIGLRIDVSQYETACQFTADYLIDKTVPKKTESPVCVRGIGELAIDGLVPQLSIPGGSPVLGMPWESNGWDAQGLPPPEFN